MKPPNISPGKWTVSDLDSPIFDYDPVAYVVNEAAIHLEVLDTEARALAHNQEARYAKYAERDSVNKANKKIIAASPRMAESMNQFVEWAHNDPDLRDLDGFVQEFTDLLKSAGYTEEEGS